MSEREWQPIETALHKDGQSRILGCDGKEQFVMRFKGEYHEPHQDKPGWFEQHIRQHPTHWMPLPAPPPTGSGSERE